MQPKNPMNVVQALLESLPEPHCILSDERWCIAANSSFIRLLQTSCEDLQSNGLGSYWPRLPEDTQNGGERTIELFSADGAEIVASVSCWVGEYVVVRVLASGAPGESLQLHHKQRIETLGLIAGGVAHDFNNVLTGILGHVAFLRHVLPRDHQGNESVEAIEEGALKAAGLTQQILNYSRLEASEQLAQVNVANVLSGITVLLKSAIPAHITLTVHPAERPFVVLASEVNIAQILINLIINARDAVSGQGTIEISLAHDLEQYECERIFGPEPAAAHYGVIQVSDNGCGMSEEVKARLFEPYFTTKNAAGTGLGLATVHSIVQQLGGVVECESQLGTGTSFRIVLPLVDDPRTEEHESQEYGGSATQGRGERILVVDDEDAVRNVLGLSLAHLGYEVETAASGREALEKFHAAQGSIRVVILDLLMPGLSGEDVFYRLREMEPDLKVLLVSGFSSSHVVERILSDGARDFIQKPFSIEVLSEKVRGCFSG